MQNIENLLLFSGEDYLRVSKGLVRTLGVECAFMFAELVDEYLYYYKQKYDILEQNNGWFYSTADNIKERTSWSPDKQEKIIKILIEKNLIQKKLAGVPARRFFYINSKEAQNLVAEYHETSFRKKRKLDSAKNGNLSQENTETIIRIPNEGNLKIKSNKDKDTASGSPSQRDISEIPNSPDTKEFLATQKQDGKQDYILNTSKKEGSSKNGILGEKLLNNSMNTKVERVAQGGAQKEKFELKTKQEVQQFVTNFKAHAIIVNGVPKTAPIFSQNEIDLITEYILRRKESYKSKVKSTPKALRGVLNDILQAREQIPLEIIFKQDEGVYVHCGTKGDKTKPYQTITLEYFKTLIQKTTFNKQDAKPTLREAIDTNRNAIKSINIDKYF